jgi:hypothetical protein
MYAAWWDLVTTFLLTSFVRLRDHILDRNAKVGEGPKEPRERLLHRLPVKCRLIEATNGRRPRGQRE